MQSPYFIQIISGSTQPDVDKLEEWEDRRLVSSTTALNTSRHVVLTGQPRVNLCLLLYEPIECNIKTTLRSFWSCDLVFNAVLLYSYLSSAAKEQAKTNTRAIQSHHPQPHPDANNPLPLAWTKPTSEKKKRSNKLVDGNSNPET